MSISVARLREIAEMPMDDYSDLARAVCDMAAAMLEAGIPQQTESSAPGSGQRSRPQALGDKLPHPCRRCGADVVTFLSRKTGKPYQCDVELQFLDKQRQLVTGVNWFHSCVLAQREGE